MTLTRAKNDLQIEAWQTHQTVIIYDDACVGKPRLIPGNPAILLAASVQEAESALGSWIDP